MATREDRVQIKIFVDAAEHRLLKLAAADGNVTIAAFIRDAALAAAGEAMRAFIPPTLEKAPSTPRKKKTN